MARQNLFDFFRKNKVIENEPKVPVKKTKEIMKELENTDSKSTERVNLRVLATPPDPEIEWNKKKNGFEVNPWPLKYNNARLTSQEVDSALKTAFQSTFNGSEAQAADGADLASYSLSDLNLRFQFAKEVSRVLDIAIPDKVLSTSITIGKIKQYLDDKVVGVQFDEKNPEAIYLDPKNYQGLNITFYDKKADISKQKQRFTEAYQKARQAEVERQREVLEKALN